MKVGGRARGLDSRRHDVAFINYRKYLPKALARLLGCESCGAGRALSSGINCFNDSDYRV
jgi:hypothetical protein